MVTARPFAECEPEEESAEWLDGCISSLEFPKSSHAFGSGQTNTEVIVRIETSPRAMTIEARTIRKLRIRILPFVFLLFVVAILDRYNIGFAALTMNKELAITSSTD
jgi:hypothetical protein